jgi:hypothetical protein
MAWGAIAMAGIQGLGALFQGNQEASAANAANKAAEKAAKEQNELDLKVWEIDYLKNISDFEWSMAATAASRYQDRVRKADYEKQQAGIVEAALQNLKLNSEAITQTYVTEEALRAKQVSNELSYSLGLDSIGAISEFNQYKESSRELSNRSALSNVQTMDTVSQYMSSIMSRSAAADKFLAETDEKGQAIQEQIITSESLQTMQRDAASITALVTDAQARNRAVARQGGSNSSGRIGLEAMQKFGRSYGEMKMQQKLQRTQLSNYNAELSGSRAAQLAAVASEINGEAEKIKYTGSKNAIQQKGYILGQMAIQDGMQSSAAAFRTKASKRLADFNDLTIPSFGLARATGRREATALLQNTVNTIKGASTPYREAIIFDPLQPIAGLKPEYSAPTKRNVPGTASIFGNAFMSAAQGAMSMSYTKENGSLGFR